MAQVNNTPLYFRKNKNETHSLVLSQLTLLESSLTH